MGKKRYGEGGVQPRTPAPGRDAKSAAAQPGPQTTKSDLQGDLDRQAEARKATPPSSGQVIDGVRTGDTAVFPAPLQQPHTADAADQLFKDVMVGPSSQQEVLDKMTVLELRINETLHEMAERHEADMRRVHDDVMAAVRRDLDSEINGLSSAIGSLRGYIAASRETVEGLKGTDDARRETLDALNNQVHGLVGKMETFEGRVGAFAKDTDDARRELDALRQADTNLNAGQTRLAARVRGIEHALEELKGAFKGIRDEAFPDVRRATIRAEQAAVAASAQVAELLPRLEYFGELALGMRDLRSFMDRVAALERWRDRHSADIADIGERVGLNELAEELRGALPPETGE